MFLQDLRKKYLYKDKTVPCDLCELWVHVKCNNLNYLDYMYLQNSNESWYCIECCRIIFSLTLYYVTKTSSLVV